MPYVVKWIAAGHWKINETPIAYPTPGEAVGFACTILIHRRLQRQHVRPIIKQRQQSGIDS